MHVLHQISTQKGEGRQIGGDAPVLWGGGGAGEGLEGAGERSAYVGQGSLLSSAMSPCTHLDSRPRISLLHKLSERP